MSDPTSTTTSPRPAFTGSPPLGWVEDEPGVFRPFWYSRTGYIVKWSLFLGLFTLFGLYITIGYWHARRQLNKGQIPKGWNRWLVSRAQLARVDPRYAYPQPAAYTMYRPDYYGMHTMPPPVYDPSRPPVYDGGPPGSTKVAPGQAGQQYQPQPPPPPPMETGVAHPQVPPQAVTSNHTGSTNPYRP